MAWMSFVVISGEKLESRRGVGVGSLAAAAEFVADGAWRGGALLSASSAAA